MAQTELVAVVDDDESVRESLPDLLRSFGFTVEPFRSAEDFLASSLRPQVGCLVLDISMPGMSGPELQMELKRIDQRVPIVFITSGVDEALHSCVLERGAVACLIKPFSEEAIHNAILKALKSI